MNNDLALTEQEPTQLIPQSELSVQNNKPPPDAKALRSAREHNPDWIERQKPCDLCGKPIGVEAMVTGVQSRYHARCLKKLSESDQPK